MADLKKYLFPILLVAPLILVLESASPTSKFSFKETSCRLIEHKFIETNPWVSYPIIFEPIHRGKLTLWTASSTIPTSELKCYGGLNTTDDKIILQFTNPAKKLDWTFYDVNKGITHNGVSVSYNQEAKYLVSLKNKKSDFYLDCNVVEKIEKVSDNELDLLQTSCPDCSHFLLQLINSQLRELIKIKLDEQITDNLHWHLSQIISSQQYNNPIPLTYSL